MELFKTAFLMTALMLLFVAVGGAIGGTSGMLVAFLVALGMNFFSYFFSDTLVLKHYKAVPVDEAHATGLYQIVRELCAKANLPMPKIYIIPEAVPNAFATGRNPSRAAVAVTEGLLNLLNKDEIEGVLAHELSHVRHYDILTGSIAAVFAGAIAILANFAQFGAANRQGKQNPLMLIALAVIMPLAATIIRMAISRAREFEADRGAAMITGKPQHLAGALRKLEDYARGRVMANADEQSAHMFIINPFSGVKSALGSLFRTHPSTQDRIAALENLRSQLDGENGVKEYFRK